MIVIGIDPGLTGAVAVMDHQGVRVVFDIPTMPVPGAGPKAMIKTKVDGHKLLSLLLQSCPAAEGKPTMVLEQVHARATGNEGRGNTMQAQASLMRTLGAIETVAECMKWPTKYVSPQSWKRKFGLGKEKSQSLETARRLHPEAAADLKRVKDHNRAEAVLLAHYGLLEVA